MTALGSTYTYKAEAAATAGSYVLVEEELRGDPTPLHTHERFFDLVVEHGEPALLQDPERLAALAEKTGTRIDGDHPDSGA